MRTTIFAVALAIGVLVSGFFARDANATSCLTIVTGQCSILNSGDTATTPDGTVFLGDPNPTQPSTGSGVFKPFLDTHTPTSGSLESGFNTDTSGSSINFDTVPRGGTVATRSVLFSELGTVACPTVGLCYELQLDANQTSGATTLANQIAITNLQIFISSNPNMAHPESTGTGINGTGYSGTQFNQSSTGDMLLGVTPKWCLDSTCLSAPPNGDVDIILQASICDSNGQCGSGHGDLDVFIPVGLLGPNNVAGQYFVLYTEYGGCGLLRTNCPGPNDGYEEWRFLGAAVPAGVPEPSSLLLLGSGLIGLGLWQWKRRSGVQI